MATERRTSRGGGNPGGEGSEWLTLGQAASYLGVAQSTVRKWSDGGRLSAFYTPGGHRRFRRVDLEMDGYLVREAGSADEGLAALEDEPPDLVLLDVMMPEVDGFEMLRRMQERHGLGSVPVIMFSGKVDEETASRAAREGAQAFIGKPFDPQALIESTKQLLSHR